MRRALVAVAVAGLALACREAPVSPLPAAVVGVDPVEPDGGPGGPPPPPPPTDGGPTEPTSTRRLVRWSPTGSLPPDNLVLNARLDVVSALAPQGLSEPPRQYVWPRTPASQPVLRVAVRDVASVLVQARPGALLAQVWVGRPADDPRLFAEVSLVGHVADAEETREVALVEDGSGEVPMNGVVWRRFSVQTPPGFIGQLQLLFDNQAEQPLYVNGPVVTAARRTLTGAAEISAAPARFASPSRRRARAAAAFDARARAAARERLAPPAVERFGR